MRACCVVLCCVMLEEWMDRWMNESLELREFAMEISV